MKKKTICKTNSFFKGFYVSGVFRLQKSGLIKRDGHSFF